MTDTPDIWPDRWPEPPTRVARTSALTPVRPIGGRVPRFGVAHDLDTAHRSAGNGGSPPSSPRAVPPGPAITATHDGFWGRLGTWWACREVHPADLWRRTQCRLGRHRFEGGQQIQLGGRFVRTERCCVWCRCKPV